MLVPAGWAATATRLIAAGPRPGRAVAVFGIMWRRMAPTTRTAVACRVATGAR